MPETLTASFALDLEDGMSGPTAEAAGALEKLKEKIEADTKALRQMQAAMKQLTSGTVSNVAAVQALQAKMNATKDTIAKTQAKFIELGGTFDGTGKKAKEASRKFVGVADAMKSLPGPVGQLAQRFAALRAAFGGGAIIVGGLLVMAAALAVVVAGTVALTASLARYAIGQADARRSELLRLETMAALGGRMADAGANAAALQGQIDRVSSRVAQGRTEVAAYAQQLYRTGLRGQALGAALERGLVRRLGGVDIARRRFLSLNVQSQKLQESFSALFNDINIEPFLEGLHTITELFSQNTVTGRTLKAIVDTLVQPLINSITAGFPIVRRFFQGLVIGALLAAIGVLALRNALVGLFGDSTLLDGVNGLRVALWAGVAVVAVLLLAVGALAVAFGVLAFSVALVAAPFFIVIAAIGLLIYAGYRLVQWFRAQNWSAIGRSIVDGLVGGIRSAATRVTEAMRDIARTAQGALEGALGIESPSRVFAGLGMQIPRGLAQGVEQGAPIAAAAIDDMASGSVPEGVSAASSTSVSVGPVTVLVQGGADVGGDELEQRIVAAFTRVFEGIAIHQGAPA